MLVFSEMRTFSRQFWHATLLFTAAMASHGILDSFTNAGLGVGFFIPFDDTRYFAPWRPLTASPLSLSRFLSGSQMPLLINEMKWIGIPVTVALSVTFLIRRLSGRRGG
jgi:inner membrane protein